MSKLIGAALIVVSVIVILPAVAGGMALNTFGTILVGIFVILGLVFITN